MTGIALLLAAGAWTPADSFRSKVSELETAIANNLTPLELPPVHYFFKGGYARELTIPKGTTMTGKIHKKENFVIMVSGDITVVTEFGKERMAGYSAHVSPIGVKRAVHAHEDTVWIAIHITDEIDLAKIEEEFIAQSYEEFDRHVASLEDPQLSLLLEGE